MHHSIRVLFLILVTLFSAKAAFAAPTCSRLLEVGSLADLRWSPIPVEVIYFPETQHTKLRIGEDVYSNQCPEDSCVREDMEAFERLPSFGKGLQLRFKMKVTPEEVAGLRDYIERGEFGENVTFGCTYSACRALNKVTKAWIPIPFSLTPFLNGIYLIASRFIPGTRVQEVTLHVPKKAGEPAFQIAGWQAVRYGLRARRIK